jgi:uncharacterized protein with GYD domain
MTQAAYTSENWASQIQHPHTRAEQLRSILEANGGRLLSFYYAFGEYDAVVIYEAPDNVSVSAVILAAVASGALKAVKTTVLMSPEEGLEAMRRASGTGYRAPGR